MEKNKKKVSPGFEPGSLDSKSKVLTITPRDREVKKMSMTGFEPATFRLEVERAIQLRHTDNQYHVILNAWGGIWTHESYALDLKSNPFDQTREPMRKL